MEYLVILGAIVPAASKKEIGNRIGSLCDILKCVNIPTNMFMHLNFCMYIYV